MRAVSFSPKVAALMGIPVDRVISFTFVVGSSLAAAAGLLYATKYPGSTSPRTRPGSSWDEGIRRRGHRRRSATSAARWRAGS
jgi:ABC-type uncharacterized transport system permease subunit